MLRVLFELEFSSECRAFLAQRRGARFLRRGSGRRGRGGALKTGWTCMGVFGVKWFLSSSVPAVAARRVDCVELLEIELGNCLELVGRSRCFEVVRQVVEPSAVFVLQRD